jgi:hypothetical protein
LNLEIVERESVYMSIEQLIGAVLIAESIDINSDLKDDGHNSI